ncbi:MAG: hypothetical protein RL204_1281 [Bacteroidota bacterium]|jgi:hypothetical protein
MKSKFSLKICSIVLTLLIASCSNAQNEKSTITEPSSFENSETPLSPKLLSRGIKVDSTACNLKVSPGKNYKSDKTKITSLRGSLYTKYSQATDSSARNAIIDSARAIFTSELLNSIIPYWYGTEWDFDGYTAIPNEGKIACGYFVSTTLKDMGLNVNRYTLAQQTPENEAKSVSIDHKKVTHFTSENIYEELPKLRSGLYFVGLYNHVGYIYVHNEVAYFLHSNYIDNKVVIERANDSRAFYSSNYYVSPITWNDILILKWLKKEEVAIYTSKN